MIIDIKAASKSDAYRFFLFLPYPVDAGAVVAVNTIVVIAVLSINARIQPGQMFYGFYFVVVGLIFVLETALVAFSAGTA